MTDTILRQTTNPHSVWRQRAIGLLLAVGVGLLQGCAAVQEPMHGLHYCNVGKTAVSSIRLHYGSLTWPPATLSSGVYKGGSDINCLGGIGFTDSMPIPEIMNVEWVAEDSTHYRVDIPIKSKLNGRYPPHTIQVRFNNDKIEVIERVYATPAQRVDFKIYP